MIQQQTHQTFVDSGKEVGPLLMSNQHSLFFGNLDDIPQIPAFTNKLMFHKIKEAGKSPSAFAFPKESELVPFFNHFIIRLQETGILGHTLKKWKASSPTEHQQNDPWKIALPMKSVVFPFAVLFGAGVISMMTLVIEYFTTWTKKKKN